MFQRWLVAIVGLPLLLAVLLLCPAWATMILVVAIAVIAAYELMHVAGKNGKEKTAYWTAGYAAVQVFCVYRARTWYLSGFLVPGAQLRAPIDPLWVMPCCLVIVLFLLAVTTYEKPDALSFRTISVAFIGGAVFPMMFSCIVLLRMHETYGRLYVLAPFFIAFAGDSLAMYCGKWFGRKKLTPVSPKKTWAGFFGSVLGSVLGMAVFGLLGNRWLGYAPSWANLALVGVVGNLLGQLGDLSTSLIKREAGVKDYSHLFLTHGGVLDRFDSTLFIAPLVYFFVSVGMM